MKDKDYNEGIMANNDIKPGCFSKYKKYLQPCKSLNSDVNHVEDGGLFNVLFFLWVLPLIKKGIKKTLGLEDLANLPPPLSSQQTLKKIKHYLQKEYLRKNKKKDEISLFRVYLDMYFAKLLIYGLLFTSGHLSGIVGAVVVARYLFEYLESPEYNIAYGCMLVCTLVILLALRMIGLQLAMFLGGRIGCYAKSAYLGLIYEKCLKLRLSGTKSVGELVNLCANDAARLYEFSVTAGSLVSTPLCILLSLLYLLLYIGPVVLVGFGIIFLYFPLSLLSGFLYAHLRKRSIHISDKRVKMISEALTFVKLIKMYAWEKPFSDVVYKLRKEERLSIQWMAFVESTSDTTSYIIASVAPVLTIIVAAYTGQDINVSKAFTLVSIFMMLKGSMKQGQLSTKKLAEITVSFKRIKDLLNMKENNATFEECPDYEDLVKMTNASFSWEKNEKKEDRNISENDEGVQDIPNVEVLPEKNILLNTKVDEDIAPILSNISITVKRKSLVGICGPVGSGKSSFLQALLNEMYILEGQCWVSSSVAYVPQQSWIMNTTVRENILFGKDYDHQHFMNVCTACALNKDLDSMKSREFTEVGERGITLSGGQKQRISLARALYSQEDVYLLDDPLSAVDANVGKHIFEQCIKQALSRKTVILVTHQLQYLQNCDYVIYMKNGQFLEEGTYKDMMSRDTLFSGDMNQHFSHHKNTDHSSENNIDPLENESLHENDYEEENIEQLNEEKLNLELIEKGKIIEEEEKKEGAVSLSTYLSFVRFCGVVPVFFMFVAAGSSVVFQIVTDYWLSIYLKERRVLIENLNANISGPNVSLNDIHQNSLNGQRNYYMKIYGGLASCMIFTTLFSAFYAVFILLTGSTFLHNAVFKAIFTSPMSFFDTTPSGRILNRVTKDIDEIDNFLPLMIYYCIVNSSRVIGNLLFIAVNVPYFLIALFAITVLFGLMNVIYRKVVRSIKRVENVTRSPVYSHLTATSQGLVTIRSFKRQELFTQMFQNRLDENIAPLLYFYGTSRWFGIYVDLICVLCAFATGLSIIILKGEVPTEIGAMCISYGLRVFGLIQFTFRLFADIEAKFTSVERLEHYFDTLKPEGEFETEDKNAIKGWPQTGDIRFENVSFRYRDNLPLVLKDISLSIEHKEKVGVVGRTGAGKSSIGVLLYRLVNPEQGSISIAGVDTNEIGLTDLRSALTIIPQDPVLFVGSIRYNLDPFQHYTDEELWNVLEKARIKELITNLPQQLESAVYENGSNFSVGERQLICMARAILRKTKILILDEATASIDSNSDAKIQETIKESFSDCTVITIAHRLNTIMDCDKIIVMEDGQVVEFDKPSELLTRDSSFSRLHLAARIT